MPTADQTAATGPTAAPERARISLLQALVLVLFAFALAGIVAAAALVDQTRSHFIWVILAGIGWTQAFALTMGSWLYRDARDMLARHREAVAHDLGVHDLTLQKRQSAVLDAIAELRGELAAVKRHVAAVELAFESGREVGQAEANGLRVIGQRPASSGTAPKVG